jgi:hypothetical protein
MYKAFLIFYIDYNLIWENKKYFYNNKEK